MFNKKGTTVSVKEPKLESPVRKPLHAAAVDFAQSVVELQRDKEALESQVSDLRGQNVSDKAEIASLQRQLDEALHRLDYYHRRVVEIETKFDVAAKIMLEVLHNSPIHPDDKPRIALSDGTEAVRAALESVSTEPTKGVN